MTLTPEEQSALDRVRKSRHYCPTGEYQSAAYWEAVWTVVDIALRDHQQLTRSIPNAVMQTTPTNCFRACVATVLGLSIEDVPTACDGATWDWDAFQDWLATRGLQAIEIGFGNGGTIYPVRKPVRCILSGKSPRECPSGRHAVVGSLLGLEGFELDHDPHQSGDWIDGEPTHATLFVSIKPPPIILTDDRSYGIESRDNVSVIQDQEENATARTDADEVSGLFDCSVVNRPFSTKLNTEYETVFVDGKITSHREIGPSDRSLAEREVQKGN